jgi:hypothetical protein
MTCEDRFHWSVFSAVLLYKLYLTCSFLWHLNSGRLAYCIISTGWLNGQLVRNATECNYRFKCKWRIKFESDASFVAEGVGPVHCSHANLWQVLCRYGYVSQSDTVYCANSIFPCQASVIPTRVRTTRLRVFQNRALKMMFVRWRKEVTEGWGKWHNEEIHDLNFVRSITGVI